MSEPSKTPEEIIREAAEKLQKKLSEIRSDFDDSGLKEKIEDTFDRIFGTGMGASHETPPPAEESATATATASAGEPSPPSEPVPPASSPAEAPSPVPPPPTGTLAGRVALVTGGARGIGRAIVERLIADGAMVAFTYNSSPDAASALVESLGNERAMAVQCDVRSGEQIASLVERVLSTWGKIHILVNNAGITKDTLVMRMSEGDFQDVLTTNLTSAFLTTKAVLRPMMSERWGRIINISSVVALVGNPGQANYVASKAGLIGLTKSVALEVASRNILVNCIAPGFVESDMTSKLNEQQGEQLLSKIPLKRVGQGADIAAMVSFLSGDDSAYITGQTFAVDGGMTMV